MKTFLRILALAVLCSMGFTSCVYDPYYAGAPYGYGYSPGYTSLAVGYGYPGYYGYSGYPYGYRYSSYYRGGYYPYRYSSYHHSPYRYGYHSGVYSSSSTGVAPHVGTRVYSHSTVGASSGFRSTSGRVSTSTSGTTTTSTTGHHWH